MKTQTGVPKLVLGSIAATLALAAHVAPAQDRDGAIPPGHLPPPEYRDNDQAVPPGHLPPPKFRGKNRNFPPGHSRDNDDDDDRGRVDNDRDNDEDDDYDRARNYGEYREERAELTREINDLEEELEELKAQRDRLDDRWSQQASN